MYLPRLVSAEHQPNWARNRLADGTRWTAPASARIAAILADPAGREVLRSVTQHGGLGRDDRVQFGNLEVEARDATMGSTPFNRGRAGRVGSRLTQNGSIVHPR